MINPNENMFSLIGVATDGSYVEVREHIGYATADGQDKYNAEETAFTDSEGELLPVPTNEALFLFGKHTSYTGDTTIVEGTPETFHHKTLITDVYDDSALSFTVESSLNGWYTYTLVRVPVLQDAEKVLPFWYDVTNAQLMCLNDSGEAIQAQAIDLLAKADLYNSYTVERLVFPKIQAIYNKVVAEKTQRIITDGGYSNRVKKLKEQEDIINTLLAGAAGKYAQGLYYEAQRIIEFIEKFIKNERLDN